MDGSFYEILKPRSFCRHVSTSQRWIYYIATLIEAYCGSVAGTMESGEAIWCQLNYVKNHSILRLELARKTYFKPVP